MTDGKQKLDYIFGLSPEMPRIIEIELTKLRPNPDQPRKRFNQETIKELAASIEQHGLIQPISVVPDPQSQDPPALSRNAARSASFVNGTEQQHRPNRDKLFTKYDKAGQGAAFRRLAGQYLAARIRGDQAGALDDPAPKRVQEFEGPRRPTISPASRAREDARYRSSQPRLWAR